MNFEYTNVVYLGDKLGVTVDLPNNRVTSTFR